MICWQTIRNLVDSQQGGRYVRLMQALREFRIERGMSQAELARRVGCTESHVSLVETGKRSPSVATLIRFGEALRIEPGRLLVGVR